ncbi:mitochondrial intermediate peptidase [Gymnopus androsaceus JB14]|uniref:Mitochondrial intermediate peptidase n=1 Tax=Gymnopus androsaceus JB14 TaxID=1447944 RepID=A0A6A4HNN4_9AGAR|nr:mitochondrial intermediate peptidase [Gymnopus androsaceus JB14]
MLANTARNGLPKCPRKIFRFQGCLFENDAFRPIYRRYAATQATLTIPASVDDRTLVTLFDEPKNSFSSSSWSHTGLFGHPSLTHPRALISLTNATLLRAQKLTDRILRARESRDELLKVVKNLDRLSDLLCGVIDLSELVRNAHPDRVWADAANHAYEALCEFMNVLNTHVGLYEVLKAVLSDQHIMDSIGPEAKQTALIFWRDFEKSAINLPPAQRDKFVSLSSEILVLGREFQRGVVAPRPPVSIRPEELSGLKDQGMGVRLQLQARFTKRDLLVYPGSLQAQMIMRAAPDEEPRRRVFVATQSSTPEQIQILETMLQKRAELSRLVGCQSFAHLTLDDKMAKSPENVNHFLTALMDHTAPAVKSALHALSLRKQEHLNTPPSPIIQAWDRDFYCPPEPPAPPYSTALTHTGLFRHLYGISLRPVHAASGEVWHTDVQKLEVVDEKQGIIGWIYADLFARRGKPGGAAHYTVRCSRRTDDDDESGDRLEEIPDYERSIRESVEFEAVKRHRLPGQEGVYQLPLVVLLCEFARPSISRGPTVLQWHEVNTLFHEMGHAMHSMIGRTEYQNVAGTRCATDFVELPSILMEHFLNSPDSAFTSPNHHVDPCHSIDTYQQILLAALDQIYHSPDVLDKNFDSTVEYAKLQNTRGIIPYVPGTSFQTQFGHLFGYCRRLGERYKDEILRFGGGRDPWKMVSAILSSPELESGDAESMRRVGNWRIEDEVGLSGRH